MTRISLLTRRSFAKVFAAGAGAVVAPALIFGQNAASVNTAADDKLQSEFLFDLVIDRGTANNVGSPGVNRVVVPVTGGTFEGPKLKGTIISPSGDWIVARPDGSSILDLRIVMETDDAQKIYMNSRGIAVPLPGAGLFARILPMFETGAPKYTWLNNVAAVGVYRPTPGKIGYRVYRIL